MCLTNRRNGQHYKLMHFTHARNWQQWLLGGRIVPQEAWQNCVQRKALLHVFSVCDPHLRGCVFKNGTEDFSSHICQNNGYLLFERCGSICLPCLWPNSLGPLYTPCQLLRKLSRAFAGTEIWSLLCSLFEPVPCVEKMEYECEYPLMLWDLSSHSSIPTALEKGTNVHDLSFKAVWAWILGG